MKWKNLRDYFRKELDKIELAQLENEDENWRHHCTWTHFESMQFLSPIMKPRLVEHLDTASRGEIPAVEVSSIDIKEKLEKHDSDNDLNINSNKTEASSESQISAIYTVHNTDSTNKEITSSQKDLEENSWPAVEMSVEEMNMSRKRKAQLSSDYLNCMRELLDLKAKKMSLLKEKCEEEYDDDMNFFKSLMPHVKQLPAINKLFFRSQVQNALAQELSKLQNLPLSMPQCDSNMPSTSNISPQVVTYVSRNDNFVEEENIIS